MTLSLSQNTHPKFVQELLGQPTITLDTNSHVLPPGMGDHTARAVEDAIGGGPPEEDGAEDAFRWVASAFLAGGALRVPLFVVPLDPARQPCR